MKYKDFIPTQLATEREAYPASCHDLQGKLRTFCNTQNAIRPPTPSTASFAAGRGTEAGISDAADSASLSPDLTAPAVAQR